MWQSNRPGSSAFPPHSTASSPSRPGPTSTMRPSSITTSASAIPAPVPSKTRPPRNTVLVITPPDPEARTIDDGPDPTAEGTTGTMATEVQVARRSNAYELFILVLTVLSLVIMVALFLPVSGPEKQ